MNTNPWGLTDAQAATLDALIEAGSPKKAARLRGCAVSLIESHIRRAMAQIKASTRIKLVIQWDRCRRDAAQIPQFIKAGKP